MNDNQKYIGLFALILALLAGILLCGAAVFYLLKVFSIAVFSIPGSDFLYQYIVTLTPFLIYFAAYYFLNKQIILSEKTGSIITARFFHIVGMISATGFLVLALLNLSGVKHEWIRLYERYSFLTLISQILLLFATTLSLATADKKEVDWMQKNKKE